MRSNQTSRISDARELSEADPGSRREHERSSSDFSRTNVTRERNDRPVVVGVPLESVKAGPHWVGASDYQQSAAGQPPVGAAQPVLAGVRPVPLNSGSGRIPEGGGNGSMKQRSVFEGPRGPGAQINEVRLRNNGPQLHQLQVVQAASRGVPNPTSSQPAPAFKAPEFRRAVGQATPVQTPSGEAEIDRIIERQLPPQGMTKKEAQQLADALTIALDVTEKAIAAGEKCFGVDDAAIADAKATRDYLANFAYNASASDRTSPTRLPKEKLDTVEHILECQMAHERLAAQNRPGIVPFLLTAAVVAGVTYLVVKNL